MASLTDRDALVVRVAADIRSLQAGLRQAAREADIAGSSMQKSLGDRAKAIEGALQSMAARAAAASLAMGYMAKRALDAADGIKDTASALNIGTEALQEFRYAATQNGVSVDQMDSALMRLNKEVGEAITAGGDAAKTFKKLGVDLYDATGKVRSTEAVLADVSEAVKGMGSAQEKAAVLAQLFGREAGPRLAEMLSQGSAGLDAMRQSARDAGAVIQSDLIDKGAEAADKLESLSAVLQAKFTTAVISSIGYVEKFGAAMAQLAGHRDLPFQEQIENLRHEMVKLGPATTEATKARLAALDAELRKLIELQQQYTRAPSAPSVPAKAGEFVGPPAPTPKTESDATAEKRAADRRKAELDAIKKHNSEIVLQSYTLVATEKALEEMRYQSRAAALRSMTEAEFAAHAKSHGIAMTRSEMLKELEIKHGEDMAKIEQDAVEQKLAIMDQVFEAAYAADALALMHERERYAMSLQALEEAKEQELFTSEEAKKLEEQMLIEHEQRKLDIKNRFREDDRRSAEMQEKAKLQFTADFLRSSLAAMSTHSKKAFQLQKGLAIADTIVNTYRAATGAYSALASIPYVGPALGAIAAAAAAAAGLANVQAIRSTQFGGGGGGQPAIPKAPTSSNGNAPAMGEGGGQRGQSVTINIDDDMIYTGAAIRKLIRAINEAGKDGATLDYVRVI